MTRSELARSVLPSHTYTDAQRRVDEEQAAKVITDSSVDHKRYKVYIDSIKRETEKAILARVGHWRSKMQREGWLPKSQVEFISDREALIPVWLARKFGYTISTDSYLYDKPRQARSQAGPLHTGETAMSLTKRWAPVRNACGAQSSCEPK
jgi:hypothetical protein